MVTLDHRIVLTLLFRIFATENCYAVIKDRCYVTISGLYSQQRTQFNQRRRNYRWFQGKTYCHINKRYRQLWTLFIRRQICNVESMDNQYSFNINIVSFWGAKCQIWQDKIARISSTSGFNFRSRNHICILSLKCSSAFITKKLFLVQFQKTITVFFKFLGVPSLENYIQTSDSMQ